MAKRPTKEAEQDATLKAIRDAFDYNFRKWEPIYKEGDTDMRYIAGDPWDDDDKQAREEAKRPALAFDELGQYINQAVNDVRANPVSPKFSPTGDGANDETARFYEALDRETEYRSNAQLADTTAYENMLQRSFGFVRIKAEFEHPRSFYQHLVIDSVPNPACFFPDADAVRPDGSDWRNADYIETYSRAEFKRAFPRAKYQTFSQEQINVVGDKWAGEDRVQVAEHWEVEMREGILVQCEIPGTSQRPPRLVEYLEGVDRKPRNCREIQRRATEVPKVRYCLTNGLELLADAEGKTWHDWAGDAIPFASCYGKILWMHTNSGAGAERVILSMTRLARNPYMAYCFAVTSLIEAIGMITKNPFFAYEGTLDATQMNEIAKSLHEPVAVLLSKPFIDGSQQLMPLPQRNPMSVDVGTHIATAEMCRRAIQAAMGWTPLPTDAQKRNDKSGIALQRIEESGQRGAYHFKDAYYMMLRRGAEIRENLYDRLYDTPRDVNVRQKDNTPERWRINDPKAQGERVLKSIKGRHSVTIDVGPEYAREREAANAFIDSFVGSPLMQALDPAKRDKLIGLAIKARNIGVMGDKMADIISPPENKAGQMDPAQAQGLLQQADQMIQALGAKVQELESGIAAKQIETQSRERIAAQTDATKRQIAATQSEEKMAIAELKTESDEKIAALDRKMDLIIATLQANQSLTEVAERRAAADEQQAHERAMAREGHMQSMESQTQAEGAAERQAERNASQKEGTE